MAAKATKTQIPEALVDFDSLPDSAYVRQPVVERLFGFSAATLWRHCASMKLKPHKLSARVTAWNVGELREALKVSK